MHGMTLVGAIGEVGHDTIAFRARGHNKRTCDYKLGYDGDGKSKGGGSMREQ